MVEELNTHKRATRLGGHQNTEISPQKAGVCARHATVRNVFAGSLDTSLD